MSLFSRAVSIYRQEGIRTLLSRSKQFLLGEILPKALWSVFPEAKTKRAVGRSRTLTTLYYYLRGSFYDEQRALLYGQSYYVEEEKRRNNPIHSIIRGTHRIEKGLSMEPRRDVFAEGYIQELVESIDTALDKHWESDREDPQLEWALDVLDEYFTVVTHTPTIERAHEQYTTILDRLDYSPGEKRPFQRHELERPDIDIDSFQRLAESRHSVRWFRDEQVDRDLIDRAIATAVESPSACNRQSFKFHVFDDNELINDLGAIPGGATGYKENIPCLVVLVGRQRAYFHDRDKHVIYVDGSLAAMTFQYALETMGVGSCCINWQTIRSNQRKIRQKLDLDEDEKVIMFMAVGYPREDGYIPYSEKKSLDTVRSYNFETERS